jgi:hypothetical protein
MSYQLDVPEDVFTRLSNAAQQEGTTPIGWIEQRLPPEKRPDIQQVKTMLELFGDSVGSISSGGKDRLSERHGELFADYLEQKRREGKL